MIPMSSADKKYVDVLKVTLQSFWAGVIVLGGVAGFLLNALSSNDVSEEIRPILIAAIRADMLMAFALCLFTVFVFFLFTGIGLHYDRKRVLSAISDVFALIFFIAAIFVAARMTVELKIMWAALSNLT